LRIDQTHKNWFIGSVVILLAAAVIYVPYDKMTIGGASGGTMIGIIYGSIGFAFMIFAGLLSLRKRYPIWRIGRTQAWMRGHLWLGLISYPIIFFHSGFSFGHGALAFWMMVLFTVVIVSGVFGAILQHYMPKVMTQQVPMETIYGDSDRIRQQLCEEAERILEDLCGPVTATSAAGAAGGSVAISTSVHVLDATAAQELQRFFAEEMLPYLEHAGAGKSRLAHGFTAKTMFDNLRTLIPPAVHDSIADLGSICEEKREIDLQQRLHRVLHGWLFVHVPLSYALLVMGAVHAIGALRY
jgi:hypothetical protein